MLSVCKILCYCGNIKRYDALISPSQCPEQSLGCPRAPGSLGSFCHSVTGAAPLRANSGPPNMSSSDRSCPNLGWSDVPCRDDKVAQAAHTQVSRVLKSSGYGGSRVNIGSKSIHCVRTLSMRPLGLTSCLGTELVNGTSLYIQGRSAGPPGSSSQR